LREDLEERDVREEEEPEEIEETIAEKEEKEDLEITESPEKPGITETIGKLGITETTEITETIEIVEITEITETTIAIEKNALREETTSETIVQEMREDASVMKIVNTKIEEIEEITTLAMRIKIKPLDMVMIGTKEDKPTVMLILS
jgi:predicted nucleic acid-binding protein